MHQNVERRALELAHWFRRQEMIAEGERERLAARAIQLLRQAEKPAAEAAAGTWVDAMRHRLATTLAQISL